MLGAVPRRLRRAIGLISSRLRWGRRFHHLGERVVLGAARECRVPHSVSIGDYTVLSDGWWLTDLEPAPGTAPRITIGRHCRFLYDFQVNSASSVTIGDGVLAGSRVFITDADHRVGDDETFTTQIQEHDTEPVVIGTNCWLGQNVVVLKGVTLGERCVVAANAVVTKSFPDDAVIGGVSRPTTELTQVGVRSSGTAPIPHIAGSRPRRRSSAHTSSR